MTYLARAISRAKWSSENNAANREIGADAVTRDLRTSNNTLSFWECGSGAIEDVEEAALAIAATRERLDKLDIVWLAAGDMEENDGQNLEKTKGNTPVADLVERHVDVCQLDYVRLGKVAQRIATAVVNKRLRRLTRSKIKDLLVKAVQQKRISRDQLSPGLQEEVQKGIPC